MEVLRMRLEMMAAEAEQAKRDAAADAEKAKMIAAADAEKAKMIAAADAEKAKMIAAAEAEQAKMIAAAEAEQAKMIAAAEAEQAKRDAAAEAEKAKLKATAEADNAKLKATADVDKAKAELEKAKLAASLATTKLWHRLTTAEVELMQVNGKLHMRGLIERVEKVKLAEMPGHDVTWSRLKKWTLILESSRNQELFSCLRQCMLGHKQQPMQVAQRILNLYEHLSGHLHVQQSADAVDIVQGSVNGEEANMLACLAKAIPVRYKQRTLTSAFMDTEVNSGDIEKADNN